MKLHFRKYGHESNQALLTLHGLFGQSDNWSSIAKKLSEHSLSVYAIDLRNHGLSPHSNEMSYELMAMDIKELIDSENILSPILLGHSMGGKVAMYFDYLFSNTLKKLMIVDIAPKKYPPGHTDVFNALHSIDFNIIKTRKETELALRKHLNNEAVIQFLLKNLYWQAQNQLNWRFHLNTIYHHYEEILKEIPQYLSSTPTAFIRGEKSPYITDTDWHDIQKIYIDSKLITISNAGHWVHAEQAQLFVNDILNYLDLS